MKNITESKFYFNEITFLSLLKSCFLILIRRLKGQVKGAKQRRWNLKSINWIYLYQVTKKNVEIRKVKNISSTIIENKGVLKKEVLIYFKLVFKYKIKKKCLQKR